MILLCFLIFGYFLLKSKVDSHDKIQNTLLSNFTQTSNTIEEMKKDIDNLKLLFPGQNSNFIALEDPIRN